MTDRRRWMKKPRSEDVFNCIFLAIVFAPLFFLIVATEAMSR